jgi:transposase
VFSELQSHYLFEDRFGRPGKGNEKGKVEGLVGFARRNFMVPVPVFDSFQALNAHLFECCKKRMSERLRGHAETIRWARRMYKRMIHQTKGGRDWFDRLRRKTPHRSGSARG